MTPMLAHLMIIDTRLSALYDAIRARDWKQVEWHADRVSRATTKAIAHAYLVLLSDDGTFTTTARTSGRRLVAYDLKALTAKIAQADKPKPPRVKIAAAVVDGDCVRNVTVRGLTTGGPTGCEAVLITWEDDGRKDKLLPYVPAYRPLTDDEREEYAVLRRLEREATARRAQWLSDHRASPVDVTGYGGHVRIERNPDLRALVHAAIAEATDAAR